MTKLSRDDCVTRALTLKRRSAVSHDTYDQSPDVAECHRCNGSGELAISSMNGLYLFPGPVPEDAKGIVSATCYDCCGCGYIEVAP